MEWRRTARLRSLLCRRVVWRSAFAGTLALTVFGGPAVAQTAPPSAAPTSAQDLVAAVVGIKSFINPDARTSDSLGRERQGSGIVIDSAGLVVTIGYLIVEAHAAQLVTQEGRTVPAEVVGYDHETGFGLLRASAPLNVRPMPLGRSADLKEGDPALVASAGGLAMSQPAWIAAKREFVGSWEYMLDQALFTTPPHPAWSGAALISRDGRLVGVGSLIVGDATGAGDGRPGNMFVPVDLLAPILADLIAEGRSSTPARPWLGVTAEEVRGRVVVARVTPGGPAEKAGIAKGDVITGINGVRATGLGDFYRKLWASGKAGISVPLDIEQNDRPRRVDIPSIDRLQHLKLKQTF